MFYDNLIVQLSKLAAESDGRLLLLLVFLAFLLTLLAWKLVEGLVTAAFAVLYSLTPQGRLAEKQRIAATQAQVDAIMAKINTAQALFQGPPKPPAAWQVVLKRMAPVAFFALIGIWGYGAWHFYQRAATLGARIAQEEAVNPLMLSTLRGPNNDEPGKTYAVATFLAIQVAAMIVSAAWQGYKVRRAARQVMAASGPSS